MILKEIIINKNIKIIIILSVHKEVICNGKN